MLSFQELKQKLPAIAKTEFACENGSCSAI